MATSGNMLLKSQRMHIESIEECLFRQVITFDIEAAKLRFIMILKKCA